jgi:hypothetical protein
MSNFIKNKPMIDPEAFTALPLDEKIEILWYYGEFLESISEGKFDVSLYELYGFYVEVFYHLNSDSLVNVKVIEDNAQLERYTASINIDELLI